MKKTAAAFLAVVILVCMCAVAGRTVLKMLYPQKYADSIAAYSARYDVDEMLVCAVIRTESSFDPDAESNVGARGLMQIMPDTLDWLCYRMGEDVPFEALSDPDTAIRYERGLFVRRQNARPHPVSRYGALRRQGRAGKGNVSKPVWIKAGA